MVEKERKRPMEFRGVADGGSEIIRRDHVCDGIGDAVSRTAPSNRFLASVRLASAMLFSCFPVVVRSKSSSNTVLGQLPYFPAVVFLFFSETVKCFYIITLNGGF